MTAAAPEQPGVAPKFDLDSLDLDQIDWAALEKEMDWDVTPFHIGPTWQKAEPGYTGDTDPDGYILPEVTLGWQAIHWIENNLLADETDEHDQPLPFSLTNEQQRFILWFYAIDPETGAFIYREVVLQRLKGWGKDPLAACIAAVEFVGPCRFKGWVEFRPGHEDEDRAWARSHGLEEGDPYAVPHPRSWGWLIGASFILAPGTRASGFWIHSFSFCGVHTMPDALRLSE